ncbi:MAG: hypothetical protein J3Q66DRAFT_38856 [Benniella sp.]|nr:MAG: hypothetical protein J3Q66DRAFT_38856 [Benniella sp.]
MVTLTHPPRVCFTIEGVVAIQQHRNERIVEAKRHNYTTIQVILGETPRPQSSQTGFSSIASGIPFGTQQPQRLMSGNMTPLPGSTGVPAAAAAVTGSVLFATRTNNNTSIVSKPTAVPDFGLNKHSVSPSTASTFSSGGLGLGTSGVSLGSTPLSMGLQGPASTSTPPSALTSVAPNNPPNIKPPTRSDMSLPFTLPTGPSGVSFGTSLPGGTAGSSTATALTSVPNQSSPIFGAPQGAVAPSGSSAGAIQPPPPSSSRTAKSPPTQVLIMPPVLPTTPRVPTVLPKPLVLPSVPGTFMSSNASPSPSTAAPATPRSDATRIVTKRGRVYPRATVESIMMDILDRETKRLIRSTAAQMLQEVMVEQSVRRAKERQETVHQESMLILSILVAQFTDQVVTDIVVDLHRETWLQRKVINRWKEYTRTCRQRAEELRRRQEHFLVNVRAMDSYAGLKDGNPVAQKIREYNAQQHRIHRGTHKRDLAKDTENLKVMVAAVSNKRKRLLSIGQEGSPDMALVAGLKKLAAPKRELWTPLPVHSIVQTKLCCPVRRPLQIQQAVSPTKEPALVKRRWRLFVGTPAFKEMTSKWLLTKLGIDIGRHTKSQQRSGTLVTVHQSQSAENTVEVIVHGSEDKSVKDLLGIPRYAIMETAAFIFEFSKIPFMDHDVSDEAIHLYWIGERDRLVRFLSCFPKVKQPIVFIMWSSGPDVWERVSPRMVEYLELDKMVGSPHGPLLGYRFLNLDMAGMKLDPYIVGSLEWLASESKQVFEDPEAMLMGLLNKYRPIYEWALCRITLAEGPLYSQYDEDDEAETRVSVGVNRGKQEPVGGNRRRQITESRQEHAGNVFVALAESGFNLAVRLFNMELESIAQTIEAKGQGETREGTEQEGQVKAAMACLIRQGQLPEIKRGAVQDRLNFGMDPKSALCDFIDVYIAMLGGLAKEQQNRAAKVVMRTAIWQMLISSDEDRVPLEAVFKQISSQVLEWVAAGILDAERFNVRMHTCPWELAQHGLQGQNQSQRQEDDREKGDVEHSKSTRNISSPQVFAPLLIHDEVDVEGNVFDYELTVQSEVRKWEKSVERQMRDREERALAVPNESIRAKLATATPLRFGDGRKRRAPERPRDALKRSRSEHASSVGVVDSDNLFLTHPPSSSEEPPVTTSPKLPTAITSEPESASTSNDRLARLRSLINEVKAGTLHQQ